MIKLPNLGKAVCLLYLFIFTNVNGQNKTQNYYSSGSEKKINSYLPDDGWDFGMSSGASFGLKSTENTIFRGNGMATKMFGRYNFGHVGLGFNTGIIPGTISSSAVSQFITERKFPVDALVNSTKPLNAYFLFGPSFNFGNKVKISADINGGIFYNNAGGLTINEQGVTRTLYRFDAGGKNLMPGLSGNLSLAYPFNNSTRFFINTDYLQTTSSIRLLDPQRGIDIATEQNRSVKLFTAGVGIIKSFKSVRDIATGQLYSKRNAALRDIASGQSSGKRVLAPKDVASGQTTGKRILVSSDPASSLSTDRNILSPRDAASGMPTGRRSVMNDGNNESCGQVIIKNTNADGSSVEKTFACTNDALQYQDQTQGATSGEKVNAGLHAAGGALAQGVSLLGNYLPGGAVISSARYILGGRVTWSGGSNLEIVTNKTTVATGKSINAPAPAAQASYARTINGFGGTGISTAIHVRDAGSGLAAGRRQYRSVFFEPDNTNCTDCMATAKSNPLYKDNNLSGNNPMYESKNIAAADNNCDGIGRLKVHLIDEASGATVAATQTESCGEFWFANVPPGNYVVKISGGFTAQKGYDVNLKNKGKFDVAGEILAADDFFSVQIITTEGTPEEAPALLKISTKSNQVNERTGNANKDNSQTKATINASNLNIKNMAVSLADTDGDGVAEIIVGNISNGTSLSGRSFQGGAVKPTPMPPGTPMGGIIVKGGRNPGGISLTVSTNRYGEFEFTDWEEGNYIITANLNYIIANEIFISIGK